MSIKGLFPIDQWNFESQSVLSGLPDDTLSLLQAHEKERKYDKGEIIFREGTRPTGIYFIKKGKAKKYKSDNVNREQIIYIAGSGELIGYHAILAESMFPDSAAAIEKSTITFIPKQDFLETLKRSDVLSRRLLKTLSHEFAVLANSIALFAQHPVRERLALQLIVLREKYKINFQPGMPVEIELSRDDLANLVGTARENVVRILTEFKQEKIIETKGRKIMVMDVKKLLKVANYKSENGRV